MMRLTLAYSSYFNKKYGGVGHVWQGRYKSSPKSGRRNMELTPFFERRVAVPTNKEERVSDACELVSRRVTDLSEAKGGEKE